VKNGFPSLLFSTTSQVWEDAPVADIMSLRVLHDVGLLTSHGPTCFPAVGSTEAPVWQRRTLTID
jgi:hypothetical protein